jgi:hypothetical protein
VEWLVRAGRVRRFWCGPDGCVSWGLEGVGCGGGRPLALGLGGFFGEAYLGPHPLTLNGTKVVVSLGSSNGGSAISSSLSREVSDVGAKMMLVWWFVLFFVVDVVV